MISETIFAVSSGRPPAGIAVIRISGPQATSSAERLAGSLPPPRQAAVRELRDAHGDLLDRALVLRFVAPATATGEDVVELHCHGGRAVIAAVEACLSTFAGLRRAEAGEFTRRALTNGRIDLLEAEGLADLLFAETEAQRRAALAGAGGALSRQVRLWMDDLTRAAAEIELQIDYADEGDTELAISTISSRVIVDRVRKQMAAVLAEPPVDRIRDGVKVVVMGPPNSGKSSLINVMAGWDVAITSPLAGTTRDRLEAWVTRSGIAFLLTDTAGITETTDPVEQIGVERAREAGAAADILLWTGDTPLRSHTADRPIINLWTRSDLSSRSLHTRGSVPFSIYDVKSRDRLWGLIVECSGGAVSPENALFSRDQRAKISDAAECLAGFENVEYDILLAAESLRTATIALSTLTGERANEVMLNALFSRFCVGK